MEKDNAIHWLGLASYEEKDASIFYGRETEVNELAEDIFHNTQTIIYGPSGTGKTSILRAGIFKKARESHFFPVYIRLNHEGKETYVRQIIREIQDKAAAGEIEIENRVGYIDPEKLSLWEFFHCNLFWNTGDFPVTPLIVFDQFEEIFTIGKPKEKLSGFFGQLSDLCDDRVPSYIKEYLSVSPERICYPEKINYRCVLVLREDFLARLEEFASNIPALKKNRYSLQAISGRQAMDIIIRPSGEIAGKEVAVRIIRKVTNRKEEATGEIQTLTVEPALLSLFCHELDKKRIERKLERITAGLVEEFGDDIIKNFYNNTLSLVEPKTGNYLEDHLLTSDGFRDRVSLQDALNGGVTEAELDILQKNRLVRLEEWDGAERIEFTHDVLCRVAMERRCNREQQQKIEEERQRVRQLRKRIYSFAIIIALLILLIGGYVIGFLMPYTEYYEDVVYRYEWPVGVNKIPAGDAAHLPAHYELTRRGMFPVGWNSRNGLYFRNWTKLSVCDAFGDILTDKRGTILVDPEDDEDEGVNEGFRKKLSRVCRYEFISDQEGRRLIQTKAYDKRKELIWCFTYSNNHLTDKKVCDYSLASYTDAKGFPIQSRKNGASVIKIRFDSLGYRKSVEFFDAFYNRAKNRNLVYAEKFEYTPEGLLRRYGSAAPAGHDSLIYCNDKAGNSGWIYEYEQNRIVKGTSVNGNGEVSPVKYGYSGYKQTYDKHGRPASISYYNECEWAFEYPDAEHRSSYHTRRNTYDDRGNVVKIEFLDHNGRLTQKGCAYKCFDFGKNTNSPIRELAYRFDGSYWCGYEGVGYRCKYENPDDRRLYTEITCLRDSITPGRGADGVYTKRYVYDKNGNKVSELYYDQSGENLMLNSEGVAGVKYRYDPQGRLMGKEYVDVDNMPSDVNDYASVRYDYDDRGNLTGEEYYDGKENKQMTSGGIASIEYKYDHFNNNVQTVLKDLEGKILGDKVILEYTYDAFGNRVQEALHGADGKSPAMNGERWHKHTMRYDDNNFMLEEYYCDKEGRLINAPGHRYAICRYENDGSNNRKSNSYYDSGDRPCNGDHGYHKHVNSYELNRLVGQKYYDVDGKACKGPGGMYAGNIVYDDRGNQAMLRALDLDGNLMNIPSGYAYISYQYDIYDNQVCISYYDKYGHPVCNGDYFRKESEYEGGLLVLEKYYKADGVYRDRACIVEYKYMDFSNRLSDIRYFDKDMNPADNPYGWSHYHADYKNGRISEEEYFDGNGNPCNVNINRLAYHKKVYQYAGGREIGAVVYDVKGNSQNIDVYDGYGIKVLDNGNRMEGNWQNGIMEGWGTYYFNNGKVYRGNFSNGVFKGRGSLTSANGVCRTGNFVDDYIEGYGVERYTNGGEYRGNFVRGEKNGTGTYYSPDNTVKMSGIFERGRLLYTYYFRITEVLEHIEGYGIKKGDIIIDFDDFHYFMGDRKFNPVDELQQTIGRVLKNKPGDHYLVVARLQGMEYGFYHVAIPAGEMAEHTGKDKVIGLQVQNSVIDFGHLDFLYRSYIRWKIKDGQR